MLASWEEIGAPVSLVAMKRKLFFVGLGLAVLVLAVGGWTVDGLRWAAKPARRGPAAKRVPAWA